MTAAIEVNNLSFRYPGAAEDTLRNVNLTIEPGDFVAVVGGNGSGKTTLCKSFNGLIPHYWSGDFAGEVLVDGIDTVNSSVGSLSSTVGYVYQDFHNQLVRPTVQDEVSYAPINYGLEDHAERTNQALELLGIDQLRDKFVWQLSGGQAHLTALAAVLALRPSIIVVDEPVAELDPARAREIYLRLRELNERGITVITIEHHAELIAEFAKSVVLMADGAPVWHLPAQEALNRADELAEHGIPTPAMIEVTRQLGAVDVPRSVPAAEAWLRRHDLVSEQTTLRPTPSVEPEGVRRGSKVVATLQDVEHGFHTVAGGFQHVINGVSLDLYEGENIALVGSNGAGKTTLLRLLTGLKVPRTGDVTVDGVNTRSRSAAKMADLVSYLYQHPQQMFLQDSVRSDVRMFPAERKIPDADAITERVLERTGLLPLAERDGRTLSGGQQRRATIAIGLAMRPQLLLLDEPTSSLDVRSRDDVIGMLSELADSIHCAVVATHDMQLVADWATRVIVLEHGQVLADLSPRELFTRPELLERARLRPPQITELGVALGLAPVPLNAQEMLESLRDPLAASFLEQESLT